MGIHSLRAEITLFEAARAHAIADGRSSVEIADIEKTARMSLRLRRSPFIDQYLDQQIQEDEEIERLVSKFNRKSTAKKTSKPKKSKSKSGSGK